MTNRRPRCDAFTLIELLASIAILLILIIGINKVFSIASHAAGAGQALSAVNRDNRATQAVVYEDLKNVALADAPFFMIHSSRVAAFRDKADMLGDRDYDPTSTRAPADLAIRSTDLDGDNLENDLAPRTSISGRNHRVDTLKFFARGQFRRQTGNNTVYVANVAAAEALITYGILLQPDNTRPLNMATSQEPGIGLSDPARNPTNNPNNFFARDWILGRNVLVLREPELDSASNLRIKDRITAEDQMYFGRSPVGAPTRLSPLTQGSQATDTGTSFDATTLIQHSRFDLAGTTIAGYNQILKDAIAAGRDDWWTEANLAFRYAGWPFPSKPLNSAGVARTTPVFLAGVSSFAVEYAGDFCTQLDATGAVTSNIPDGTTDYVPVFNGAGNPPTRRTRWYGFPRNVDTSDDNDATAPGGVRIRGATGAAAGGTDLLDVVPLRDVLQTAGIAESAPFERKLDPSATGGSVLPVKGNYATATGVSLDASYICAWGPSNTFTNWAGAPVADPPYPRMLRFVFGMDDQNGRLAEPQLFEYVVELH